MSEEANEFIEVESGALPPQSPLFSGSDSERSAASQIHPFSILRTPVTLSRWLDIQEWAINNGYDLHDAQGVATPGQPACKVSWFDAVKWCNARSEMEGLKPCYIVTAGEAAGQVFRKGQFEDLAEAEEGEINRLVDYCTNATGYKLPTEAEWEWAATGATKSKNCQFSGSDNLDEVGWYEGNIPNEPSGSQWVFGTGLEKVAQKKANELGLFDMSGNVFEWIEDLWDATYRHIRGGSFRSGAEECRVFYRDKADQTKRVDNLGFRIVKVASARNKAHSW